MFKNAMFLGLFTSLFSFEVMASQIIEFGDPELIDVFETSEALNPTNKTISLPPTPVRILSQKGSRYAFNIEKTTYWVEGVDVETSDRVQVESLCNSTQLSTNYDVDHYGIRGAGIGCKK